MCSYFGVIQINNKSRILHIFVVQCVYLYINTITSLFQRLSALNFPL